MENIFSYMLFVALCVTYLKPVNSEYVCTSPPSNNLKLLIPKSQISAANTGVQSLRIITEYTEEYEALTHSDEMKEMIDKAVKYWSEALSVVDARQDGFQIPKQCINGQYQKVASSDDVEGGGYCETGCEKEFTCGEIDIPEKYLQCQKMDDGNPTIEKGDDNNLDAADFLLLVYHKPSEHCKENTLVVAETCAINAERNRPEVGYINFCKDIGSTEFPNDILGYQAVRHQLGHALGFNAAMFAYMRDKDGQPRTERDATGSPVTEKEDGHFKASGNTIQATTLSWYSEVFQGPRPVSILRTPEVLTAAKKHFDCQELEGVELEDVGVKNNHFKRRVVLDELMSAITTVNSKVSALTLGYFQDSGWYEVNTDKAEKWTWGHNLRCDFVQKSCYEYIQRQTQKRELYRPWCAELQSLDTECIMDSSAFGSCNMVEYPQDLPEMFQYFPAGGEYGPAYGGSDKYADYCPYIKISENDCMTKTTICTSEDNMEHTGLNPLLQKYGETSICLNHHSSQPWTYYGDDYEKLFTNKMASCHEYECSPQKGLVIKMGENEVQCHDEPREVEFEGRDYVGKLQGTIICPGCSNICDTCPVNE